MTMNGAIWPDDDAPRAWCHHCNSDKLIDDESVEGVWTRHGEELVDVLHLSCGHSVSAERA